jgi:hypothetical protein
MKKCNSPYGIQHMISVVCSAGSQPPAPLTHPFMMPCFEITSSDQNVSRRCKVGVKHLPFQWGRSFQDVQMQRLVELDVGKVTVLH